MNSNVQKCTGKCKVKPHYFFVSNKNFVSDNLLRYTNNFLERILKLLMTNGAKNWNEKVQ